MPSKQGRNEPAVSKRRAGDGTALAENAANREEGEELSIAPRPSIPSRGCDNFFPPSTGVGRMGPTDELLQRYAPEK